MNRSEPKIVLFDIETLPDLDKVMEVFPQLSNYPGLTLKASINSVICFGYKIFGEKEIKCINAWDFKSWDKNVNNDLEIIKAAYEVLKDADAVVGHNSKRFDWKFIQTRLAIHGLEPLPRIKHIDTCNESRKNLMMFSNRLGEISKLLFDDKKTENGGWPLWCKVMKRDKQAMAMMTKYCKQDVNLTEKLFKKIRPYVTNIPNYNLFESGEKVLCPSCGSTRLEKRGFGTTKVRMFQKYVCKDCRSWSQVGIKDHMPR